MLRAAATAAGKMAAAASCSSAVAAPAGPGPGPGPVSAGPGSCEWLLLRDGCLRCDADGLCSLCYHPALNAILAVTARGAIKVIDGTSGATLQASALNGECGHPRPAGPLRRGPGGARIGPWQPSGRLQGTISAPRSPGEAGPEGFVTQVWWWARDFGVGRLLRKRPACVRARGAAKAPLALFQPWLFMPEQLLLRWAEILV